jgi:hypothetical protein
MCRYVGLGLDRLTRCFRSHRSLLLENLALRQQLAVLKRKHPRPRMGAVDKIFWVFVRRFWDAWKQSLVLVNPETVVRWHRAGFRRLREAFPFGAAPRFLIHDRDAKYGREVPAAIRSLKINAVRTSFESPWQNGVAERWVGSCRRELLDHVIALNERYLKRLLSEYVSYHHEDRTHLGLCKETPSRRIRSRRPVR